MSLIKRNIFANLAGNFWSTCMSLVFIPLYIQFMGIEAYGLIGIFIIMQSLSPILDMGIGATLNREMARFSVLPDKSQNARNMLRTLEIIYFGLGFMIMVIVFLAAPYISHKWINYGRISPIDIQSALVIMGVVVALQALSGFYSGGLLGLQKQVLVNVINMIISTLRGLGAIIVLWLVSPTIQAFFIWQALVGILQTSLLAYFLWEKMPQGSSRAVFKMSLLKEVWYFAAGISGITVMGMILTQIDKIILSRLLPLEIFGYYVLAGTVAMGLYRLIGPVSFAIYPKLAQLAALDDQKKLASLYHTASQLMSVVILPCAVIIAFFPKEILFLWKQSPATIGNAHFLLSILVLGTALNGLMNIPYGLQLAYGWTKLVFYLNLIATVVLIPSIFYLVPIYGVTAAASAWVVLNSFYLITGIHIMHGRLLKSEERRWWLDDVGKPLAAAVLTALAGRLFINTGQPYLIMFLLLAAIFFLSILFSVFACTQLRQRIFVNLGFTAKLTLPLKLWMQRQ